MKDSDFEKGMLHVTNIRIPNEENSKVRNSEMKLLHWHSARPRSLAVMELCANMAYN
jgi:hypothetical protein